MIIKTLTDLDTARKIGEFLTSPNAFEQEWAPNEKAIVLKSPVDSVGKDKHRYWYVEDDGG